MTKEEESVFKNYDAEQCSRRIWNEKEQCRQRAEDFEKLGKKMFIDKLTGLAFWK